MMVNNLVVEQVDVASLKHYEKNPKIHKSKQIAQIANSIKEFKFNNPILIDEKNEIIAGHGRLFAAQQLEIKRVPVIRLLHLSDAQKRAYRIADNKLTENGEWDIDLLKLEFAELEKLDLDFTLDITGFDIADIDVILDSSLTDKEIKIDEMANAVPFITEDEIVSNQGDIWQLGKHRIICGNSLNQNTYKLLFEDKKANMVFTDPPYNVKVDGHVCGLGKIKHKEFSMASGEMSEDEFQDFLIDSFSLLKEFSTDGSLHFICMDWRHIKEIINAGSRVYDDFKNLCVWNKDNGGMGSLYRSKHELVFIFKNGNRSHKNNVELGSHGRYRTNVWDYPGVNSFGGDKDKLKFHPTVKPVEMVKDAILDVTNRNQIVLDAFLGSGTTLVAAEKAGRICYGIEMEPLYIDTTIRRWQEITGKSAIHLQTDKSYRELFELKGNKNG
ncbi:MAG: site-specific DNA-methyltransferase [Candidatus Gastranaerophilales bacterium]|nr:site-specific DNA-methyltransferase [Candidatus Gastranaerophilales bacterium]